jgi:hypothetical protein
VELGQNYIQNPPEGMTARLVWSMTDFNLLDMYYIFIKNDDLDDYKFEEGLYVFNDIVRRTFV